jgi:hypothetical protein
VRTPAWLLLLLLPAAPAQGQHRDLHVRAGLFGFWSHRDAKFLDSDSTGRGTALQGGGEVSLRWRSLLGLSARVFGGSFSADGANDAAVGDVSNLDVQLAAGPSLLNARVGFGRRAFSGAFGARPWSFARLGAGTAFPLGIRGLDLELSAVFYVAVSDAAGNDGSRGREAELRLTYEPPRFLPFPVDLTLGYRYERFTVEASDATGGDRPEKIASVLFGAGVRFPP